MISSALLLFVLLTAFHLVGMATNRVLKLSSRLGQTVLAQITGFSVAVLAASASYWLEISPHWSLLAAISIALGILTMSVKRNVKKRFSSIREAIFGLLAMTIPAVTFLFLQVGGGLTPRIAWRTGPDNFGWLAAAAAVSRDDAGSKLEGRLEYALQPGTLDTAFVRPGEIELESYRYISQIPSATDQVVAEFLIGGERIGLPSLVAAVARLIQAESVVSTFFAFSAWAIGVVALLLYKFARQNDVSRGVSLILAWTLPMNFSLLSVALEGGYGQLLSAPIVVYLMAVMVSRHLVAREVFLPIGLLFLFSATSYLDLPIYILPVVAILGFLRIQSSHRWREVLPWLLKEPKDLLLLLPGLLFVPGLAAVALGRIADGGTGGWSTVQIALPANIVGLANWLPPGFPALLLRSDRTLDVPIDIALSVGLLLLPLLFGFRNSHLLVSGLATYVAISAAIYVPELVAGKSLWSGSTYPVWKFGFFAALIFALQIVVYFSSWARMRTESASRNHALRQERKLVSLVLALTLLIQSSADWVQGWTDNRKLSPDRSVQAFPLSLAKEYDLIVKNEAWFVGSLLPDLRYGELTRAFDLPTSRSPDSRPLVLVQRPDASRNPQSISRLLKLTIVEAEVIGETREFVALLLVEGEH